MLADSERVEPADRSQWRSWLEANHAEAKAVWLVYPKKRSGLPGIKYEEAVEEALCFGWIDSKVRRLDADRFLQYFSPRRVGSIWSKLNKDRVARLAAAGLMREPGLAKVAAAREDGSWDLLDQVDAMVVPDDLRSALGAEPAAGDGFARLPDSAVKGILWWLATAKRAETRERRISQTVAAAARGEGPFPAEGRSPGGGSRTDSTP